MSISKLPSQSLSYKPAVKVSPQQAPAAPAGPAARPAPTQPLSKADTFKASPSPRGPDLLGGTPRRGPASTSGAPEGKSIPAHLLRFGGQALQNLTLSGPRGLEQVGIPTRVANTLQPLTDPREGPVDLTPYIELAATDPDAALAALDDLKELAANDPQLMRYVGLMERAILNPTYQHWVSEGATISLTTSAGNGGEPVMVLAPPGFDPHETVERPVHTHYHGLGSPVAGDPAMEGEISAIWESTDPAPIFVLPEAVTLETDIDGPNEEWRTHGGWPDEPNVELTTQDGLSALYGGQVEEDRIGERVVSAHSRGGAAITRSIMTDPASVRADRLLLLDTLYNTEPPGGDRANSADDVDPDLKIRDWLRTVDAEQVGQVIVVAGDYPDASTSPNLTGEAASDPRIVLDNTAPSHEAALTEGMDYAFPEASEP